MYIIHISPILISYIVAVCSSLHFSTVVYYIEWRLAGLARDFTVTLCQPQQHSLAGPSETHNTD